MNSILLQHKEKIVKNQIDLDKFIVDNAGIKCVANRRLVRGIGVNNSDYANKLKVNGKQITCPIYQTWIDMLKRCYSVKFQEKFPTYKGCTVCDEWLSFIAFKSWVIYQDYKEKELDKDLLFIGNKVYSPEACMFVSHSLNNLMNDHAAKRGFYPRGVSFYKGRYRALVKINGKQKYLGCFATSKEAESVYIRAKTENIMRIALEQTDKKLMNALINQASHMIDNLNR